MEDPLDNKIASAFFSAIRSFNADHAMVEFSGGGDDGSVDMTSWTVMSGHYFNSYDINDTIQSNLDHFDIKNSKMIGEKFWTIVVATLSSLMNEKVNAKVEAVLSNFLYMTCIPTSFDGSGQVWGCILFDSKEMKIVTAHSFEEIRPVRGDLQELDFPYLSTIQQVDQDLLD